MSGPGSRYTTANAMQNSQSPATLHPIRCRFGRVSLGLEGRAGACVVRFYNLLNWHNLPRYDVHTIRICQTMKLDAYDRKILAALQRDGRLSNVQLADEIGLSASPCLRRVRMLEEAGVIRGYQANLDRDEVGLAVTALPEVISAFLVSGESDFLLQVVVPDLRAYDHFLTGQLLKLPGVSDIRSNFAIHTVKTPGALPLEHLPSL